MLLPALAKAREKARQISCTNNMKQCTLAMAMYTNDNNGQFLINGMPFDITGHAGYPFYWYEAIVYHDVLHLGSAYKTGLRPNNSGNHYYCKQFLCPSAPMHAGQHHAANSACDFAYNYYLCGGSGTGITAIGNEASIQRNLSRTIMFCDDWKHLQVDGSSDWVRVDDAARLAGFNLYSGNRATKSNVGKTYGPHAGTMTTGFVDGHVESSKSIEVNKDELYINVWDTGTIVSKANN